MKQMNKLDKNRDEIEKLEQKNKARISIFEKIIQNIKANIKIIEKCKNDPIMWLKIRSKYVLLKNHSSYKLFV